MYEISGSRREADEKCALLGCYAASGGKFLPTFRDNLSLQSWILDPLRCDPIGRPKMSVRN
jgi:hypothetical protein